jgi:hypothetical protein
MSLQEAAVNYEATVNYLFFLVHSGSTLSCSWSIFYNLTYSVTSIAEILIQADRVSDLCVLMHSNCVITFIKFSYILMAQ